IRTATGGRRYPTCPVVWRPERLSTRRYAGSEALSSFICAECVKTVSDHRHLVNALCVRGVRRDRSTSTPQWRWRPNTAIQPPGFAGCSDRRVVEVCGDDKARRDSDRAVGRVWRLAEA